ncbi:MAG: bifunctional folylpolyglutamate synthase/dihydrofolate synthase [Chloroflexota bacterium]|nr:MAG: bifunctional folylpolyglutamate synthase/dihydrofolate synthase [Chloroflexota bacterium]
MSSRYQEALDYLYGLVNFEHRRIDQYTSENISLDRPRRLLRLVGDPQNSFQAIHIAGTKGKGSVAAMCAAIFRAAGYRVGLYTSPHLFDFRDRIRFVTPQDGDGRIDKAHVAELVDLLKPAVAQMPEVTWYEVVTALAFMHFAREKVDLAVVEVGLGGRLDATNILTPLVSVITSLSLDHTILLGDTLPEIAAEKGGIIKPGIPLVTAPQVAEALETLLKIADSEDAPVTIVGRDWRWQAVPRPHKDNMTRPPGGQQIILSRVTEAAFVRPPLHLTLALAGRHQQENAVVALAAVDKTAGAYPRLDANAVIDGIAQVDWPGRLQILSSGDDRPTLLADCAHNADSAAKLAFALSHDYQYGTLWLILGITADKDKRGILRELLPLAERAIMTTSGHPRAAGPGELVELAAELGVQAQASPSVAEAVLYTWRRARSEDLICVSGSIFVVGDLLYHWEGLQSELRAPAEVIHLPSSAADLDDG